MTLNPVHDALAINTLTDSVKVGDGVTFLHYSDRSPGTVAKVIPFASGARQGQPRVIYIRPDDYKVIKGSAYDGTAQYEIIPNESNPMIIARLGRRGWVTPSGTRVQVGDRDAYSDPSF